MWKILGIVIILIGLIILTLVLTKAHWWKINNEAKVFTNEEPLSSAKVYQNRDGSILIDLRPDDGLYIVRPEQQEIGMSSPSSFFTLWIYAYSRNVPPPFTPMNSVKSIEPQLVVQENYVEFNSINKGRVRVMLYFK